MAESILVTGKKISSMELVTNVTGNEKIPTGQPDDLALTPNQIADHTIARGDLANQEDLSQVEVELGSQIDSSNNSIRGLIAAEEAARIAADNLKVDKEGSVSSVAGRVGDVVLTPSDVLVEGFGSQEDVNKYVPKPFLSGYTYGLGERVVLSDGEVVKSLVDGNVGNPNVNMTGWVSAVSDSLSDTIQTFNTPEAGVDPVTGVTDGTYFNVHSLSDELYADEYQNVSGSAVATGKRYLSALGVEQQEKPANTIKDESGKTQQEVNNSVTKDSSLSVVSGFPNNNADQVLSFLQFNKMLAKFQPNAEISIEKPIVVDLTGTESTEIDLQGATLNFKTGGKITFRGKSTPYLTTNVTADLIRGGTNFKVSSIAGVAIGDLIVVKSPVALTAGVTLSQTYLVQGVDAATNTIFVMGYIVGDMRADQITSQGLTGNITVDCYKVANHIKIRNGKITSINRDDETTEILIDGFRYADVTGLSPDKPTRTGVNFNYCGVVNIDKCFTIDVGYVLNDQGYNSVSTSPSGLSYGYGFLASYCYCVNFMNNHVMAGWHGFDVARGVTFAIAMNNTLHKGAFGLSSHEGQWAFFMQGNTVLGGHALTCRSMELTFKDNTCRGIKSRMLIGGGRLQSLIIDGNDIELSTEFPSNWVYFINGFNASCYSNAEPIAIVSNNNIRGMSTYPVLTVAKNLRLTGNDFGFAGTNISLTALDAGGDLVLEDNKHNGVVSQSVYNVTTNFGSITIDGEVDRTTATLSNGAMIYMSAACPKINILDNTTTDKSFIVRNVGNVSLNFDKVIQNKALGGRIFNWTSTGTVVDKFIDNIEGGALPTDNVVTYNTRLRNIFLSKTYTVNKVQDWPSLENNAQQSTTVALSGVVIGDGVQATMDIPLQGTRIWAEVAAENVVTIYQSNSTGATVDLPSGTLLVELV